MRFSPDVAVVCSMYTGMEGVKVMWVVVEGTVCLRSTSAFWFILSRRAEVAVWVAGADTPMYLHERHVYVGVGWRK